MLPIRHRGAFVFLFTKTMGEEQASLAFWNSGTAISFCVHVSVHTENFWHGMEVSTRTFVVYKTSFASVENQVSR